jgi:hypothetical protein
MTAGTVMGRKPLVKVATEPGGWRSAASSGSGRTRMTTLPACENGAERASKSGLKDDKKPVKEVGCEPEG